MHRNFPPEIICNVLRHLDHHTLLQVVYNGCLKEYMTGVCEVVTNHNKRLYYWNQPGFRRTSLNSLKVSGNKIYLVEIVDIDTLDHVQLEKLLSLSGLVFVYDANEFHLDVFGGIKSFLRSLVSNSGLTIIKAYFKQFSELNLSGVIDPEKLRYLNFDLRLQSVELESELCKLSTCKLSIYDCNASFFANTSNSVFDNIITLFIQNDVYRQDAQLVLSNVSFRRLRKCTLFNFSKLHEIEFSCLQELNIGLISPHTESDDDPLISNVNCPELQCLKITSYHGNFVINCLKTSSKLQSITLTNASRHREPKIISQGGLWHKDWKFTHRQIAT